LFDLKFHSHKFWGLLERVCPREATSITVKRDRLINTPRYTRNGSRYD